MKYWIEIHNMYLSTDYFGTRLIIFGNNMNAIGNHFLYQVRGHMLVKLIYLHDDRFFWNLTDYIRQ